MTEAGTRAGKGSGLLLFWPEESKQHLPVLWPGMILLAAAAHVGLLALFDLVFPAPSPEDITPRPVFLFGTGQLPPGQRAWLEAADPAAFSPAHTEEDRLEPAVVRVFHPRFLTARAPILEPGAVREEEADFLGEAAPFFFPHGVFEQLPSGPEERSAKGWILHWVTGDAPIGATTQEAAPALPGNRRGVDQPPWFLVGILPEGIPGLVTLVSGSGDELWDETVANHLRALRWPSVEGTAWRWHQVTLRPGRQENLATPEELFLLPPTPPAP
jgi:hypothetical protein